VERVWEDQRDCTPVSVPTPARHDRRRIAILVGGLGSSSGDAAVLGLDTAALGYADDDVAQFSYEGGQATGERMLDRVPVRDYQRSSTWGDLTDTGAHLRDLLVDVAAAHPGVPVDLIGHSQGGIVIRAALDGPDTWAPDLPVIANVITMGTPHHGAAAATAANVIGLAGFGETVLRAVQVVSLGRAPAASRATQQLASFSRLIESLGERSLPAGARVTSIASDRDRTVDSQLSAIDHATNVVVDVESDLWGAHDALPGDPDTRREVALALHGLRPTCRP
jgi:pimeloyl-ACP methyl ester carboxylesterase